MGQGDEKNGEFKEFNFGDNIENISLTESIKKAHGNVPAKKLNPNGGDGGTW